MLKQTAVALGVAFSLSGCVSTGAESVCRPDTVIPIANAEIETKSSDERKVIVLPVDLEFEDSAKTKLQTVFRNELENQISATGTELVDRKLADKLKGELKLAEQSGRYNKTGVAIADFAILTEVTASELSRDHAKAHVATNILTGKDVLVPAKCTYNVDVHAVVRVVALPDMNTVKRIELEGDHSITTETSNSSCPITADGYAGLATKAAQEAVDYNVELQTMLAASAPVLEVRQCEAGTMAKIALGQNKNVSPRDIVEFSTVIKNAQGELETFPIGEGKIVDIPGHGIKAKYSWVDIDEEMSLKLHKGDAAKILPKECKNMLDLECLTKSTLKDMGL